MSENSSRHSLRRSKRYTLLIFVVFFSLSGFISSNRVLPLEADSEVNGDATPPVIIHEPVTNGTERQRILIEAIITDDVAVAEATLYYRKIGDVTYASVAMELCIGCEDVYEGVIPASVVTTAGVEYYISATDGTNVATHPATNPDGSPHVIAMIEESQPPTFPWTWLILLVLLVVVAAVASILVRRKTKRISRK